MSPYSHFSVSCLYNESQTTDGASQFSLHSIFSFLTEGVFSLVYFLVHFGFFNKDLKNNCEQLQLLPTSTQEKMACFSLSQHNILLILLKLSNNQHAFIN